MANTQKKAISNRNKNQARQKVQKGKSENTKNNNKQKETFKTKKRIKATKIVGLVSV